MDFTADKMDIQNDTMSNTGIEIQEISVKIGASPLFSALNAQFSLGQIVGIVGANGTGKSTLLQILAGLNRPDNGHVLWNSASIYKDLVKFKSTLGYMPANHFLYPHLTVAENLHFIGQLHQGTAACVHTWSSILAQCDLLGYQKVLYGKLSDGLKKRVGLAAVLLHQPALLILDEPCAQLDPKQRQHLWAQLKQQRHPNRLIIFSSHHIDEIQGWCDEIFTLAQGKLMPQIAQSTLEHQEAPEYEMA